MLLLEINAAEVLCFSRFLKPQSCSQALCAASTVVRGLSGGEEAAVLAPARGSPAVGEWKRFDPPAVKKCPDCPLHWPPYKAG